MKEIAVQFSVTNAPLLTVTKPTMARRRKNPIIATPRNLFNPSSRSHQMQFVTVLPIISLSSLTDLKENLVRMAANNKSMKSTTTPSPTLTEFRLKTPLMDITQTKSRVASSYRLAAPNIPKSSLSYPTILPRAGTAHRSIHRSQQQQQQQQQSPPPPPLGARFLCVANPPVPSQRSISARIIPQSNVAPLPLHQQPHLLASPLLPRPHPQYGHFLAYLRRQSLARIRRKQQEQDEGYLDGVETTITFNSSRPLPTLFHSTSNLFARPPSPDTSSMPALSLHTKRKHHYIPPSHRIFQRSSSSLPTNYRLKLNQTLSSPSLSPSPPPPPPPLIKQPTPSPRLYSKKLSDDLPVVLPQRPVLITPANSVVDEAIIFPTKKPPYELQLSGDMLNYCYVSDSGVKYQGQLLSSPV